MLADATMYDVNKHMLQLRRLAYHIKHRYFNLSSIVVAIAAVIGLGWAWGSVSVMQRNYTLQRNLDAKERALTLMELEVDTLEYEKRYYASAEYQELSAREHLGLANKGEKVLILPENTPAAKQFGQSTAPVATPHAKPSNFEQWMDFLLGNNSSK